MRTTAIRKGGPSNIQERITSLKAIAVEMISSNSSIRCLIDSNWCLKAAYTKRSQFSISINAKLSRTSNSSNSFNINLRPFQTLALINESAILSYRCKKKIKHSENLGWTPSFSRAFSKFPCAHALCQYLVCTYACLFVWEFTLGNQ